MMRGSTIPGKPGNRRDHQKGTGETTSRPRKMREARGLGATRIPRRVGVSRQTNYAIESGEYLPNKGVALQLARVLEVSVEGPFSPTAAPAIIPGQHQRRASCYCER